MIYLDGEQLAVALLLISDSTIRELYRSRRMFINGPETAVIAGVELSG